MHLPPTPHPGASLTSILDSLIAPCTLESISLSYLLPPAATQKRQPTNVVFRERDPPKVEVNEANWARESVVWRERDNGKRFLGDGETLSCEEVSRV